MEGTPRAAASAGLVLLLAAVLAALSAAQALAAEPVAAIPVRPLANISLAEVSGPLQPLTKIDCGNATVVVYGVEQGKPVVVVVYATGGDWRSSIPACVDALKPCLATLGAETLGRLEALAASKAPLSLTVAAEPRGAKLETHGAEAAVASATAAAEGKASATTIASPPPAAAGTRGAAPTRSEERGEPGAPQAATGLARAGLVLLSGAAAAAVTMAWARRAATP